MSDLAKSRLQFYYQNIDGLGDKSKRENLKTLSQTNDFNIFILVETKLNSSIKKNELFDKSFKVSRKDLITPKKKSKGGVLIAVKKDFTFVQQKVRPLRLNEKHHVQCTWIKIDLNGSGILNVCALYIHPNCSADNFKSFFKEFVRIYEKAQDELFLIAGDFNFTTYQKYLTGQYTPAKMNRTKLAVFKRAIDRCDLGLVNPFTNSNGAMLDMVFCSNSIRNQIITTGSSSRLQNRVEQHPALCFEFDCSQRRHMQLPNIPSLSETIRLPQLSPEVIHELSSDDESNTSTNVESAVHFIAKVHEDILRKLVEEIRPSAIEFNLKFNQIKHHFVTLSLANQNKIAEVFSLVNHRADSAIPRLYLSGNLKEFFDNVKWLEQSLNILHEEFAVLTNRFTQK